MTRPCQSSLPTTPHCQLPLPPRQSMRTLMLTFTLNVDDGIGISSDQVTITIDHNDLPTVKAGADQTVQEGQTVDPANRLPTTTHCQLPLPPRQSMRHCQSSLPTTPHCQLPLRLSNEPRQSMRTLK